MRKPNWRAAFFMATGLLMGPEPQRIWTSGWEDSFQRPCIELNLWRETGEECDTSTQLLCSSELFSGDSARMTSWTRAQFIAESHTGTLYSSQFACMHVDCGAHTGTGRAPPTGRLTVCWDIMTDSKLAIAICLYYKISRKIFQRIVSKVSIQSPCKFSFSCEHELLPLHEQQEVLFHLLSSLSPQFALLLAHGLLGTLFPLIVSVPLPVFLPNYLISYCPFHSFFFPPPHSLTTEQALPFLSPFPSLHLPFNFYSPICFPTSHTANSPLFSFPPNFALPLLPRPSGAECLPFHPFPL